MLCDGEYAVPFSAVLAEGLQVWQGRMGSDGHCQTRLIGDVLLRIGQARLAVREDELVHEG